MLHLSFDRQGCRLDALLHPNIMFIVYQGSSYGRDMGCESASCVGLQEWLNSHSPMCPHCRQVLVASDLVPCHRFVEEVQQHIRKLETQPTLVSDRHANDRSMVPRTTTINDTYAIAFLIHRHLGIDHHQEQCARHNAPMYYYCYDCKSALCPDCIMLDPIVRNVVYVILCPC